MEQVRIYDFTTGAETSAQPDAGTPTAESDLATKGYVDAVSALLVSWNADLADAASPAMVANHKVWEFQDGVIQKLAVLVKVHRNYNAGNQLKMRVGFFANATSGTVLFKTTTTLIRKAVATAFTSTANQHASTNSAVTLAAPANAYNETEIDLTNASGQINSVAVAAGDMLLVELQRDTTTDTAAATANLVDGATEVFSV